MKKKKVMAIALSCVLSLGLLAGCGSTSNNNKSNNPSTASTKPIVLRLADIQPADYPTVQADNKFAQLVSQMTNGRIKIQVYPNGQLGDEKSTIEQVQFGAIDIVRASIAPLGDFDKEMNVLMLPYIFKDKDQMFRVLDGPVGQKVLTDLQQSKIVGLGWIDAGARNFYVTKKDIKSPDDLKGLKIRVQESSLMVDMVKAFGASPTPLAYGEVYSALQSGVIDGAENNWLSYLSTNHYQVAKHIVVDEHTRVPELIMMSKMVYDKLSPADQKIMEEAGQQAAQYERTVWATAEQNAMNTVASKGVTITKLASNQAFQDKVQPLYAKYGKGYEDLIQQIQNTK